MSTPQTGRTSLFETSHRDFVCLEEIEQVEALYVEFVDEIMIQMEAGSTTVFASFDLEQAVDFRQKLDEAIHEMARA